MDTKVKISHRALMIRVNRKLAKKEQLLKKCKPSSAAYPDLGGYYVIDTMQNSVTSKNCNFEELAKELDVLKPWEELES